MTEKSGEFELRNLLHDRDKSPSQKTGVVEKWKSWVSRFNEAYFSEKNKMLRRTLLVLGTASIIYNSSLLLGHVPAVRELGSAQESVITTEVSSKIDVLNGGLTFDKDEISPWGYHKRPIWERDGKLFVPGGEEDIKGSIQEKDLGKYVILNKKLDAWNAAYQDKSEEQNTSAYPVIKKDKLAKILSEGKDINIKKDADFAVHAVLVTKPETQQSVSNQGKK